MYFTRFVALCCVLFFVQVTVSAQITNKKAAFRAIKTLEGVWFMPTDRGDRLEIWKVEDDSTMVGRSVRIKQEDGDTVTLETLRLTRRDTNIIYSAVVRGQNSNKPVDFELTEAYSDEFLFENPAHDDPKKIKYILLGNRELQVTTEGKKSDRVITHEYVFEREFNPASAEFRVRGGINAASLFSERKLNTIEQQPEFGYRPGWELGVGGVFKGRGGFLAINVELAFSGKNSSIVSRFFADSNLYVRNGHYRTTWFNAAVFPEFTFRRDGKLSMIVGPYYSRLALSRVIGESSPASKNKLFNSNNDLKKNDFGLMGGLQYKMNFGKKDLGGKMGARFNLGLTDLDKLYKRRCLNPALCNESIVLRSISVYYAINLVKL
jgi:hypothetical protein